MLIKKNIQEVKQFNQHKNFIINFFKNKLLDLKAVERDIKLKEIANKKIQIKEQTKELELFKQNIIGNTEGEIKEITLVEEITLVDQKIGLCNTQIYELDILVDSILSDYKNFEIKINQVSISNLYFFSENFLLVKDWHYEFSEFIKKIKNSEKELLQKISSNTFLLIFFLQNLSFNTDFINNNINLLYGWQLLFHNSKFRRKFNRRKIFRKRFIFYKLKKFSKRKFKWIKVLNLIKFKNFFYSKVIPSNNSLLKKIPLTHRVISKNNLKIFYKMFKEKKKNNSTKIYKLYNSKFFKKKFKIYFRDFNQKPFWKLRQARIAHWNLFFKKTIRQQRYLPFITKYMKRYTNLCYNMIFFFNFFFKTQLSWTRLSKIESFLKVSLVKNSHIFIKLPIFFFKVFKWKSLKKKNFYLKKKIGKWSYLNYKKSQKPWLQRRKNNNPKFINHKEPDFFFLKAISYWDFCTGTIYIKKKLSSFSLPTIDNFKVNWQIKLHVFRYNPSKVWLYH